MNTEETRPLNGECARDGQVSDPGVAGPPVEDVHHWARRMRIRTVLISLVVAVALPMLSAWNASMLPDPVWRPGPVEVPRFAGELSIVLFLSMVYLAIMLTIGWVVGSVIIAISPRWLVKDKDGRRH